MSDELEKKVKDLEAEVQDGAPAWVVTFGDLMSLLLCFFVLLLSFSEMDRAKYKEVAGSLSKAFGVQRKIKAFEAPKGIKMIAKDFDQEIIPPHRREEFLRTQERQAIGEELKKEIESRFNDIKDLLQVDVGKDQITIRLMGEAAFRSGSAQLRGELLPLMEKIGYALKGTKGDLIVAGHTDNVPIVGGAYVNNLRLSIARAISVAEFLINQTGIDPGRIATIGFGEYRPMKPNTTKEGRKKNRRVEIVLKTPEPSVKPDFH